MIPWLTAATLIITSHNSGTWKIINNLSSQSFHYLQSNKRSFIILRVHLQKFVKLQYLYAVHRIYFHSSFKFEILKLIWIYHVNMSALVLCIRVKSTIMIHFILHLTYFSSVESIKKIKCFSFLIRTIITQTGVFTLWEIAIRFSIQ